RFNNGFHTLTAKAYDAAGNVSASAPVRVLTYNVSTTANDAALGHPAPGVPPPATLPMNGALTASYDPSFGNVVFVWEFDPVSGAGAGAAASASAVSVSAAPHATWTPTSTLNLSTLDLAPGAYHLWVAAILPDGSASASA